MWFHSYENCILCCKHLRYLHKTNTSVIIIFSAIRPAKFHLSSINIGRVSFFSYVIYSSPATHCQQCTSAGRKNITKEATYKNNGASNIKCGLLDGREDNKHTGVGSMEVSRIFLMQDGMFLGMVALYGGYSAIFPHERCIGSLPYHLAAAGWPNKVQQFPFMPRQELAVQGRNSVS